APVAVQEHRHASYHSVRNSKLFKPPGDLLQRLVDRALLLEMHGSLLQRPIKVAVQKLFVRDHDFTTLSLHAFPAPERTRAPSSYMMGRIESSRGSHA